MTIENEQNIYGKGTSRPNEAQGLVWQQPNTAIRER